MSDDKLEDAIRVVAHILQEAVIGCDEFDAGGRVLAAARRWLDFPTDDDVIAAAKAMHEAAIPEFDIEEIRWEDCHELYQMDRALAARAALSAVLRVSS